MDLILSGGRYFEEPLPSITNWVWVCSFPAGIATSVPTAFDRWIGYCYRQEVEISPPMEVIEFGLRIS